MKIFRKWRVSMSMPERDRRASHLLTGMLGRKRARLCAIVDDLSIGSAWAQHAAHLVAAWMKAPILTADQSRSGLLSLTPPVLAVVVYIGLDVVKETGVPRGRLTRARAVARRRCLTSSPASSLEPELDGPLLTPGCALRSERPNSARREVLARRRRRRPRGVDSLPSSFSKCIRSPLL